MKVKIRCTQCHGSGEVMVREKLIDSDGSEDIGATPHPEGCSRCKGEGEYYIEVETLDLLDKCPYCGKNFSIQKVFNKVKESLLGHTQDLTHWLDSNGVIKIDAMNTRFVEKEVGDSRIELYNTFLERDRLGNYHGYWRKQEVIKIIKYLTDWLGRH